MARRTVLALTLLAAVAKGVAGCGDPVEPQGEPPAGVPPARLQARGGAELERLAPEVRLSPSLPRAVAGEQPAGPVHRGVVSPDAPLEAELTLQNGYCFVVAAVAPAARDIDLFLYEPDGTPLQQDTTPDARPVLGMHRPICPERPTSYPLRLVAHRGAGPVALRVFIESGPVTPQTR